MNHGNLNFDMDVHISKSKDIFFYVLILEMCCKWKQLPVCFMPSSYILPIDSTASPNIKSINSRSYIEDISLCTARNCFSAFKANRHMDVVRET